jgi:hypothetical protein
VYNRDKVVGDKNGIEGSWAMKVRTRHPEITVNSTARRVNRGQCDQNMTSRTGRLRQKNRDGRTVVGRTNMTDQSGPDI